MEITSKLSPRVWDNQKVRFLAVGGVNTALGYGLFTILYIWLHHLLGYLIVAIISHFIAVLISFKLHRTIVFGVQGSMLKELFRYNISVAGNWLISLAFLSLLVSVFMVNPLYAQGVVIIARLGISFIIHKYYTFRR